MGSLTGAHVCDRALFRELLLTVCSGDWYWSANHLLLVHNEINKEVWNTHVDIFVTFLHIAEKPKMACLMSVNMVLHLNFV